MKKNKNSGLVIWLTGLPCSGKTTISKSLKRYFQKRGSLAQVLDGNIMRDTICSDLGFSKKDRDENIRRTAYLASMLSKNKINVIVAFVSPYRKMRNFARKICPNFIEVYVECEINECIKRDVKGEYKKAMEGKIKNFTGIQDPYEKPNNPELVLKTDRYSLKKNVDDLISLIKRYEK